VVITRCGKPIARLSRNAERAGLSDTQRAARERLRERMRRGCNLGGPRADRDKLH
jgi:hypothetical protein